MKDLIQKRLDKYAALTEQDEENGLKEITQEIGLYGLAKSGFFDHALFQGGTCLRIVHQLDRFSEDLNFALRKPGHFDLAPYLEKTATFMKAYGFEMEVTGGERADKNVQTRFLKDDSIKRIVTLKHLRDQRKKINIKFELDTNPPEQAVEEMRFVDFPTDFSILCHNVPTLMSGKIHALLCRKYVKGRDWYDFAWYIAQKELPNYAFLQAALKQMGPWEAQEIEVNREWLKKELAEKIQTLDWKKVVTDVTPFLRDDKVSEVEKLWSKEFFLMKVSKL
jgi:predicted nucleotidyltransferase component of viral defense system